MSSRGKIIKKYAPELDGTSGDYPPDSYSMLAKIENQSWWFVWRNRIIQHFFKKYLGDGHYKILEIGCGTGFVMQGLKEMCPRYELHGADIHSAGMKFAQTRMPEAEFYQLDASRMPFSEEFDAVGMFDSLEHITDDEAVIRGAGKALKPSGKFFITVPQHPFLWGHEDDFGGHKRRYRRAELKGKLEQNGFTVLAMTSFVSVLFPVLCCVRLLQSRTRSPVETMTIKSGRQLAPGAVMSGIASLAMWMDFASIRVGFSLPIGGSLLAVAEKCKNGYGWAE